MSIFANRPALRWAVPAVATAAVIGGGAAVGTLAASADPALPSRSAAQLLVDVQTARLDGLSGTVVQTADLGLPPVVGALGGQVGDGLTQLLAGTHTLKVWYSGPDKSRVALQGTRGQSDFIRNGRDIWTWNSQTNTGSHRVLGADQAGKDPESLPEGMPKSPQEAADLVLKAVDPSTRVSTQGTAKVAGRDAYELVLAPRDGASTIRTVRLAIDAERHIPLRVQVYGAGKDKPAVEVAFTQVDFARPDAAQFAFNPPPGAKIDEAKPGDAPAHKVPGGIERLPDGKEKSVVLGDTWTSVLVARLPDEATDPAQQQKAGAAAGIDATKLLGGLPKVSGSWGSGRLFSSTLVNALLTDDGRLVVGAVTPERLYASAADPKAALK
ncbi:LolA family protein [Rhizomonospora bruguierae]|uniref:LolA family protein n=1 Tax=Rhizomonospora bruguierae TaxID=1581705 RepID=UPI001BCD18F7|nr:sigma-E factor regulatory protein RseB domain-containing protein [Micromonospora sp. NBRC 107566]